jgi:hypothetical protein
MRARDAARAQERTRERCWIEARPSCARWTRIAREGPLAVGVACERCRSRHALLSLTRMMTAALQMNIAHALLLRCIAALRSRVVIVR